MSTYTNLPHPILVLIRGLPGSGKSYLTVELQKSIGTDATVVLDPDTIDYDSQQYKDHVAAQTAEGVDPALHAYRFSRGRAYQGISDHKIVIWNQPFTNMEIFLKMIDRLQEHAAGQNTTLPMVIVEVAIDPTVAKERVAERKRAGGHGPSDSLFARYIGDYTTAKEQGYAVVPVNGQDDIAISVASVLAAIAPLTIG